MKKIHIIPTDKPSKLWLTWLTWLSKLWFVKNPSCEEFKVEWHTSSINKRVYKIIIPSKEPKQETLEEAAENFVNNTRLRNYKVLFIEGAKWMQERMYSEEEVFRLTLESLNLGMEIRQNQLNGYCGKSGKELHIEWFDNLKK